MTKSPVLRVFLSFLVVLLAPLSSLAAESPVVKARWQVVASGAQNPDAAAHATGIEELTLPHTFSFDKTSSWWIIGSFDRADLPEMDDLWFHAGDLLSAAEIWCNGSLLYRHGTLDGEIRYFVGQKHPVLIPRSLLQDSGNVIAIRLVMEHGARVIMRPFQWLDPSDLYWWTATNRWLNTELFGVFAFLTLFLFLYYILQFAGKPEYGPNLLFALSNLCFAIYFSRMAWSMDFLPFNFTYAFTRAFLFPALAFLLLFFVEYTKVLDNRRFKLAVGAVAAITFLVCFLFGLPGTTAAGDIFTLCMLPGIMAIFTVLGITIAGMRRGQKNLLIILIGTLLGVAMGTWDTYALVTGWDAPVWLQGIGIFLFDFSVFASSSVRAMRTARALEVSEAATRRHQERQAATMEHIKAMAGELVPASRRLGKVIEASGSALKGIQTEILSIQSALEEEFASAGGIQSTVERLSQAVENINRDVEAQSLHLEETSRAVGSMLEGIDVSTASISRTAGFTRELDQAVREARESAKSSLAAMGTIKTMSDSINDITNTVQDLAEQTNLLSMNAAIEAAHAGEAGKGFAVVAGEIKRLAGGSGDKSRDISRRIKEIQESILKGSAVTGNMGTLLETLGANAAEASSSIEGIYQGARSQKDSSSRIQGILESLKAVSGSIRSQTGQQAKGNTELARDMEELVESLRLIRDSALRINERLSDLNQVSRDITEAHQGNKEVIARLEGIMAD